MRDILVTAIILGMIPLILKHPKYGIYTWSWLGYMNPHRLTWSFAYSLPFAQIVALATLVSMLAWKQPKRLPVNKITVFWLLFIVWMSLTTLFAMYDYAWFQYTTVIKIQLMTLATIIVIRTKNELDVLIWVIALSIGFYSVKGGLFTLATLGSFRVYGPEGSFIEENNALAVASLMVLPLFFYLLQQTRQTYIRLALFGFMVLTAVSIIGSQSRGALLAIAATGFYLWLKTPRKMISGLFIVVFAAGIFTFMPQSWHDRMNTIEHYEQDTSAMGRIAAWKMSFNLANNRPLGAGFSPWSPATYRLYSNNPDDWSRNTAAHSIYFSVLAEHGWIGLILFLTIYFGAWLQAGKLAKQARGDPELKWARDLMLMIQVSLVAYGSGGAFLQLTYFDLPWHLVSIVVIVQVIMGFGVKQENRVMANSFQRVTR